ncbi:MAG: DUF6159 family protein [Actinomycetota bacterium]
MAGRFRRGWRLLEQSWRVLRADPEMLVLAVAAVLVYGAVLAAFLLPGLLIDTTHSGGHTRIHTHYVWFVPMLLAMTIVGTFVAAAVVGMASIRLEGGDPTLGDGLRMAIRRLPKLIGWSIFSATVGLVIRLVQERVPLAGQIAAAIAGIAWSLATLLVIPVLVMEDVGVGESLKRSARLFKERWGEEVTGAGGIGLGLLVFFLPVMVVSGVVVAISPVAGIAMMAVGIGALMVAAFTLNAIFTTALYRFAVAGEAKGPFTAEDMRAAFPEKRISLRRWWQRRRR